MILIPTGTDAPIYHWPYATVGLIVLNVVLLFAVPADSATPVLDEDDNVVEAASVSAFDRYALTLGDGKVHPMQWVTHNFLHYGFLHLLGNMVFLWAFGIVIEGKLGALWYLLAYLAIGTLHGAVMQTVMMRSGTEVHAAGASAVVYGLLAACMVWAPRNELNCMVILWIGFRVLVFHWDLYFTTVAIWYIVEQAFNLALGGTLHGRVMVSELGHLSGALWGAVVAIVLLKAGLVDCEQWDIFSLWAKHRRLAHEWKARGERQEYEKRVLRETVRAAHGTKRANSPNGASSDGPADPDRTAAAVKKVHGLIAKGDLDGALAAYDRGTRTLVKWPPQADLRALIKAFHAKGAEADSLRLMRDHCRYYPEASSRIRLKLAQILIRDRQRPVAALRVLDEIPAGSLPPDLEKVRNQLARQADRMREDGVLELDGDDS
jgi:membrane associated rhomboid family serine protease